MHAMMKMDKGMGKDMGMSDGEILNMIQDLLAKRGGQMEMEAPEEDSDVDAIVKSVAPKAPIG